MWAIAATREECATDQSRLKQIKPARNPVPSVLNTLSRKCLDEQPDTAMKPCNVVTVRTWLQIIVVAVSISSVCSGPVLSQTCEDQNPPHAVALLLRLQSYCENYDVPNSFDLYGLAAVAGDEAIPALRKIAACLPIPQRAITASGG